MSAMKEFLADVESLVESSSLELVSDALDFLRAARGEPYINSKAAPAMLTMLQTILARIDMEPVDSVFPCSAMREDIRRVIAEASEA